MIFSAYIIACALIAGEPDLGNCTLIADTRGPFRSYFACDYRKREMIKEMESNDLKSLVMETLDTTEGIAHVGYCKNRFTGEVIGPNSKL